MSAEVPLQKYLLIKDNKLKIWSVAGKIYEYKHLDMSISNGCDVAIFIGDPCNIINLATSRYDFDNNTVNRRTHEFLTWVQSLNIKNKIFVAGNKSPQIENKKVDPSKYEGIIYLEESHCVIDGMKFYGSPYRSKNVGKKYIIQ